MHTIFLPVAGVVAQVMSAEQAGVTA